MQRSATVHYAYMGLAYDQTPALVTMVMRLQLLAVTEVNGYRNKNTSEVFYIMLSTCFQQITLLVASRFLCHLLLAVASSDEMINSDPFAFCPDKFYL